MRISNKSVTIRVKMNIAKIDNESGRGGGGGMSMMIKIKMRTINKDKKEGRIGR